MLFFAGEMEEPCKVREHCGEVALDHIVYKGAKIYSPSPRSSF